MNLPNALTTLRFLLIPVFVYYYFADIPAVYITVFLLSGLSDVLDGYLARRFNMQTDWGAAFDPIADKLTQLVTVFCIALNGVSVMWVAFAIMLAKELIMVTVGVRIYRKQEIIVTAKWYGKLSTVLFYLVVFVIICFKDNLPPTAITGTVILSLLMSFTAGIMYITDYYGEIKQIGKKKK